MQQCLTGRVSSSTFVGRAAQLARLDAALGRTAEASPTAVLVAGEAEVGKSRPVEELTARIAGTGPTVLAGGCIALADGELPYAPVVEALRR
jgi:predicted ATPase